ncbi:MAG: hypothetical protein ABH889_02490 [Candidatus Portnoybacteria bacterium]
MVQHLRFFGDAQNLRPEVKEKLKMNVFEKLYKEIKGEYGMPKGQWKLWCKRPKTRQEREEVAIGAILTQRTNWKNAELALNNLKKAKITSLKDIYRLGAKTLAPLIRPSGFYQAKAQYLFNLTRFIVKNYGGLAGIRKAELKELREELLELKGIGPETADSILLYALDKPVFVIDEYTRRLVKKRGLADNLSYPFLQKLFEKNLRKDFRLYQDFHALIVIDGKIRRIN